MWCHYLRTGADRSTLPTPVQTFIALGISATRVGITERGGGGGPSSCPRPPDTGPARPGLPHRPGRAGALRLVGHSAAVGGGITAGSSSAEGWTAGVCRLRVTGLMY